MIGFVGWLLAVYQQVYFYPFDTYNVHDVSMIPESVENVTSINTVDIGDVFAILSFALFGLIEPDNLPPIGYSPYFTVIFVKIVFFLYHLVTLIVLINLLIATMSDTYQRIQAQSDIEWKFGRASLIRNMKKSNSFPSPICIPITMYRYIRLLVKYRGAACDVGLNYEDEHEKKSRVHPLVESSSFNDIGTAENISKKLRIDEVVDWDDVRVRYNALRGKRTDENLLDSIRETAFNETNENGVRRRNGIVTKQPLQ